MSMSPEMREKFKQKMVDQLRQNSAKADEAEKAAKKEAEELFKVAEIEALDNQKRFSELFFDPMKELGLPDFAMDTFHHLHEEWPDHITDMVPDVDKNYQLNKQAIYDFCVSDDEFAFLVGQPGSGKTSMPLQVAARTGRPVFVQSFSNDLEADEWVMSKEIDNEGTHWKVLAFVETLAYPCYSVLDEFNRLRRGGRLLMNRLLNEGGSMQLRDGREITPHPQWRAVATDNTRGMGDGLDKFDGDISDISTTDRFGLMIEVPYLPIDQQTALVKAWFPEINEKVATDLVLFGEKIITGYKSGALPLPWTPRRLKKAAKLTLRYRNPRMGLQGAYYNFLAEDDEKKACNQALKDVGVAAKFGEFV